MTDPKFRTGDLVQIEFAGRCVDGAVQLASPNGRSLMLVFEAVLGGYVGSMPVLATDDAHFADLVTGQSVSIRARPIEP